MEILNLKKFVNLVNIYMELRVLYECETWTIGEAERWKLETIEIPYYIIVFKIKWLDKISNEDILDRIRVKKTLGENLKKRRAQMIGRLRQGCGTFRVVTDSNSVYFMVVDSSLSNLQIWCIHYIIFIVKTVVIPRSWFDFTLIYLQIAYFGAFWEI